MSKQPSRDILSRSKTIVVLLSQHGINQSREHVEPFTRVLAEQLDLGERRQRWVRAGGSGTAMDILTFIKEARDAGATDEAFWRVFLATHFGRLSADSTEMESAGRFLCAFGPEPTWTWAKVSLDLDAFVRDLQNHEAELKTLRFGNHRKYRSAQPQALAKIIESFIQWVKAHGAGRPSIAFIPHQSSTAEQGFCELYHRFDVDDFGRLGRFDLLCLLGDMGLVDIRPDSCYLVDSTGPMAGAKKLCGASAARFSNRKLGEIMDEVARDLEVPYVVMEDALCMWQKKPKKRSSEQLPRRHLSTIHTYSRRATRQAAMRLTRAGSGQHSA
jgi:hypothetical protein